QPRGFGACNLKFLWSLELKTSSMRELMKKAATVWPWLAAICSGLLYTGCFAPFNLTWLCWIALTPLIAAIWFSGRESRLPWLRNLLLGYVTGLTFFWTAFSWLTTVTVLGWFVLQFYMAIYLALWAWFCGLVQPRERSEEHTSELQSRSDLVCRLLLEKKNAYSTRPTCPRPSRPRLRFCLFPSST